MLHHEVVNAVDHERPRTAEEEARNDIEKRIFKHSDHLKVCHKVVLVQHRIEVQVEVAVLDKPWYDVTEVRRSFQLHFRHILQQDFDVQRRLMIQSEMKSRIEQYLVRLLIGKDLSDSFSSSIEDIPHASLNSFTFFLDLLKLCGLSIVMNWIIDDSCLPAVVENTQVVDGESLKVFEHCLHFSSVVSGEFGVHEAGAIVEQVVVPLQVELVRFDATVVLFKLVFDNETHIRVGGRHVVIE
jgi:hypothetical protein